MVTTEGARSLGGRGRAICSSSAPRVVPRRTARLWAAQTSLESLLRRVPSGPHAFLEPARRRQGAPRAIHSTPSETRLQTTASYLQVNKSGAIVTLYTAPPAGSVTVCLDQMGPESAKSFPGPRLVQAVPSSPTQPVERARQEIDYGRRGKGYLFGAFQPATGEAFTAPY